jgi:hypothetical protein
MPHNRGDEHLDRSDRRRSQRELAEVELELPTVVVGPEDMRPDLRFHYSSFRVVCRC